MTPGRRLAAWIDRHYPYRDAITHLKIQKLMFYCYGVALAFNYTSVFGGPIAFEPWDHGPVNRDVWRALRQHRARAVPRGQELRLDMNVRDAEVSYGSAVDSKLLCALRIYGSLDAWSLRCQTHTEAPWKDAHARRLERIDENAISAHFKLKYRSGRVEYPQYVMDPGSFVIDGLPVCEHPTIESLADSVYRIASL